MVHLTDNQINQSLNNQLLYKKKLIFKLWFVVIANRLTLNGLNARKKMKTFFSGHGLELWFNLLSFLSLFF